MKLPESQRSVVMGTQMEVVSELPEDDRKIMMRVTDQAKSHELTYEQNRGFPKIDMKLFYRFMTNALPMTLEENQISSGKIYLTGYVWHFMIGTSFAISYMMIFGDGTWLLVFTWGVFIWLTMMVLMPQMMPIVKFPNWFPIIPLIAHILLEVPFGYFAKLILENNGANLLDSLKP